MDKKEEYLDYIQGKLDEKFKKIQINDAEFYVLPNQVVFHIAFMKFGGENNAFVVEFADDENEAKRNNTDDGDLYYLSEWTPKKMFLEMMKEIENEM